MAFCKLWPLALKLVLLCLPQCLLGWSIATHLDPRFWFVFIVYSCSSFYFQPFGVTLYLVFCSYIDFFWSHSEQLKTPFLIIKVNVLSVKQMVTIESIKKKKKTSTSNPPLQGQLLLYFDCTTALYFIYLFFSSL